MQVEFEAVCGPKFMTVWDNVRDTLQLSTHLTDCLCLSMPCFVPKIQAVKSAVKLRSRPKRWFLGPGFARGYPRFRTCVCKLQLLPTMWPIFVQFRSAISEIRRRKKEDRKKEEEERKKKHW